MIREFSTCYVLYNVNAISGGPQLARDVQSMPSNRNTHILYVNGKNLVQNRMHGKKNSKTEGP